MLLTFDLRKGEGSLWFYAPNKGAPIAFAILFAISGAIHLYQTMYDCPDTNQQTKNYGLLL